jgi:hypothetical protein
MMITTYFGKKIEPLQVNGAPEEYRVTVTIKFLPTSHPPFHADPQGIENSYQNARCEVVSADRVYISNDATSITGKYTTGTLKPRFSH